jgi:hypothetical protein
VGPTLGAFGVTGTLADPIVELRQGQTLVQANDNWLASDAATIAASGAFALPNGSLDAALVLTLKPEAYTAQTRGANNGSGIALVEIFDADANAGSSRLVNASTRAFVGTGAAVLIPGIAVSGSGNAGLLVRAAGPALAKFGLSGVLADPVITVYRGNEVVGLNDDWGMAQTSAVRGGANPTLAGRGAERGGAGGRGVSIRQREPRCGSAHHVARRHQLHGAGQREK